MVINFLIVFAFLFTISTTLVGRASSVVVTQLHHAALRGNLNKVRTLIANGHELETQDDKGLTPFEIAVEARHPDIAALLLRATSGINGRDNRGWTPLNFAIVSDNEKLILEFLEAGANPNLGRGQNAFAVARIMHTEQKLKRFITFVNYPTLLRKLGIETTPMHLAAARGNLQDIKTIEKDLHDLDAFANVNAHGGNIKPIHVASMYGHINVIKYLLESGVDVNTNTGQSSFREARTAIEFAAKYGQIEAMRVLHENGAELGNALILAVKKTQVQEVEFLVKKGADLEGIDPEGDGKDQTPLQAVLAIGRDITVGERWETESRKLEDVFAIAQLLVNNGADVNNFVRKHHRKFAPYMRYDYPIIVATAISHLPLIKLLAQNGADLHTRMKSRSDLNFVPQSWLRELFSFSYQGDYYYKKYTPLELSIAQGTDEITAYLRTEIEIQRQQERDRRLPPNLNEAYP